MSEQSKKTRKRGVVRSDKMDQTVTVNVERLVRHPLYEKFLRRRSSLMAHNPHNIARQGDLVEIESTRPLSRRKRWRVVRVLRREVAPEAGELVPGAREAQTSSAETPEQAGQ